MDFVWIVHLFGVGAVGDYLRMICGVFFLRISKGFQKEYECFSGFFKATDHSYRLGLVGIAGDCFGILRSRCNFDHFSLCAAM